jgi:hypothetical protein
MAKKKRNIDREFEVTKEIKPSVKFGPKAPPLGDSLDTRHLRSWIRYGKISAEVFCRDNKRRVELGLPAILVED